MFNYPTLIQCKSFKEIQKISNEKHTIWSGNIDVIISLDYGNLVT